MKEIVVLVDYKGHFNSKNNAVPYRSGMDKEVLVEEFGKHGYGINFIHFSEVDFRKDWSNTTVLYTSQEDLGGHYKNFIEDIVLGLELSGANVVPDFKYLRAHNNKVLMEIIRDNLPLEDVKNIHTKYFGTWEELNMQIEHIKFPVVIKKAEGAMSSNVALANNKKELKRKVKEMSKTPNGLLDIKDALRPYKHKGYILESRNRYKFILQNFIPGLSNDWKVLVFGDKYYVFQRGNRKNDFRASGSGHDGYLYGSSANIPEGLLDYTKTIFDSLNIPIASLDIAYAEGTFYLFEYQALYFGTVGHWRSDVFYSYQEDSKTFKMIDDFVSLESAYVQAIVKSL